MNGQPTAQNNREAGCDGEFPGFRNHQNPDHMAELAELWNIEKIQVPHWNQPTHIQNMLKYMEDGSIRMVWVSGTNPLVSFPNLNKIRDIFTKPELFIVCQDIFMTETAALADVVLPAAQWGEKTGCFTNVDRTVHISHKAVEPPGEARPDLEIFLDYSRRMQFQNKDGEELMPWTQPEEVSKAWQLLSKGRPCDYTGMSYKKLSGGSGIQWPCNSQNPSGKERLFDNAMFFTDIEYCESFGHDLETGVPYSKEYYKTLNPAGRALLKSCHYIPSFETPDKEFPLRLSTGRNVYHFHTRTKTGRSALQNACPEPEVRISELDAKSHGVSDGDMVAIRSRRGEVEMKVKVGRISPGQAFTPFHFGYWDSKDKRARAANELTIEEWDPISKQPTFKSGAVSISKLPLSTKAFVREKQSDAEAKASHKDASTDSVAVQDLAGRQRQLEMWLGETYEGIVLLFDIYDVLLPRFVSDSETHSGTCVLRHITKRVRDELRPHVEKFGENQSRGRHMAHVLQEALFPAQSKGSKSDETTVSFDVLEALKGLQVYLSHISSGISVLVPVSQAIWDQKFSESVEFCLAQVARMQAWVAQQLTVRAPQTLLVPGK